MRYLYSDSNVWHVEVASQYPDAVMGEIGGFGIHKKYNGKLGYRRARLIDVKGTYSGYTKEYRVDGTGFEFCIHVIEKD